MTRNKKPKAVEFPPDSCMNCTFCHDFEGEYGCMAMPSYISGHDAEGYALYERGVPAAVDDVICVYFKRRMNA